MSRHGLQSSFVKAVLAIALAAQAVVAGATVTMVGTRVIYDAKSQGQTLQFVNRNGGPSVMQLWVDAGNEQSTPETADAPFVVTPPVFRIEPGGGQTVRLVFIGKDLPQDRESVFFLNSLQIPSLNKTHAERNQMLVMVRNRLKVFYRPPGIAGQPDPSAGSLAFRVGGAGGDRHVAASNGSGYFVSVADGQLICGAHTVALKPLMIAPFSDAQLKLAGRCPPDSAPVRVEIRYIDDHGAVRGAQFPVTAQSAQ